MVTKFIGQLKQEMPPLISRNHPKFKEWTGVGDRRMASLNCLGQDTKERVLRGREIVYPLEALLEWIAERLREVGSHAGR